MTTKKELFQRNIRVIDRVVRGRLAKTGRTVHGSRAQNEQLPRNLQKKTKDWDIFAKDPKKAAMNMEKALDKKFGGDFFKTKKGTGSPGVKVYKVKSNVTDEGFVDFASPKREIPTVSKRGVNMATLADQIRQAKENVSNPKVKYRHAKDLDLIRRYNKFKKK